MKQGVFVTGTDTAIGKTLVSALLVSAFAHAGLRPGYFKPVQTGDDSDTDRVERLTLLSKVEIRRPVYSFPDPLAPSRAAAKSGEVISLERIEAAWLEMPDQPWVIEGAGGLLAPLNGRETIRDLIARLGVSVILVASTKLGTINHTLLTLEALKRRRIPITAIVLNGEEDSGLLQTLRDFFELPTVFFLPKLERISADRVGEIASQVFPKQALKALFFDERSP